MEFEFQSFHFVYHFPERELTVIKRHQGLFQLDSFYVR